MAGHDDGNSTIDFYRRFGRSLEACGNEMRDGRFGIGDYIESCPEVDEVDQYLYDITDFVRPFDQDDADWRAEQAADAMWNGMSIAYITGIRVDYDLQVPLYLRLMALADIELQADYGLEGYEEVIGRIAFTPLTLLARELYAFAGDDVDPPARPDFFKGVAFMVGTMGWARLYGRELLSAANEIQRQEMLVYEDVDKEFKSTSAPHE